MAGRLGVLVTLYLLLVNNYKQLKTPAKLGYGYVDEWFILIQMPVLVAILEYGFILVWKRYSRYLVKQITLQKYLVKVLELLTFLLVSAYLVVIMVYGCQKFVRVNTI